MTTAFDEIMAVRGKGAPLAGEVSIANSDPVLDSRFRLGQTCAAALAGVGVAVNDIWEMKTAQRQHIGIDVRHAAAALKSAYYLQRPDSSGGFQTIVNAGHQAMMNITQPWATQDGRFVLTHFGLPHLQARMLALLGCEPTPESVAAAVAKWKALDLEAAIDEHRLCGGMVRSSEEWLASPHGQVLSGKPIVEIIRIGDSDPQPFPSSNDAGDRPLSGVRVLDLTRILAGPVCARTLAEHGAEVLMVTAQSLPQMPEAVIDTSHGKRSCFLDLNDANDARTLRALASQADVFSQGYRPGMIGKHGFGPEDLAAIRPGIVYTSISCYGADGPFSHRAGWEQVAQTMTGICHDNNPKRPHLLPAAACDYTTGYLAAFGVLVALARRAVEGGSWHVRVSLCQTGMLIHRQGLLDQTPAGLDLAPAELDAIRIETSPPHLGPLRHLGPILRMSQTPARWTRPTPKLGGDPARWVDL